MFRPPVPRHRRALAASLVALATVQLAPATTAQFNDAWVAFEETPSLFAVGGPADDTVANGEKFLGVHRSSSSWLRLRCRQP